MAQVAVGLTVSEPDALLCSTLSIYTQYGPLFPHGGQIERGDDQCTQIERRPALQRPAQLFRACARDVEECG